MDIKLFDSELKVMSVLWREGDATAKHISDVLKEETGWHMNTAPTRITATPATGLEHEHYVYADKTVYQKRRHCALRTTFYVSCPDSARSSARCRNR